MLQKCDHVITTCCQLRPYCVTMHDLIPQDETHYFVMTAKKQSLLKRGVLIHNEPDTAKLLATSNINQVKQ